ncbi:hypothetical protein SESBI_06090 [Sesbania bispinosa]|nr:hypothetical protein SESBI_06090 [Sesbania bispinosa]
MSTPNYLMQASVIPVGVCEEIERLCRNFIWGSSAEKRKMHLISWHKICQPKNLGGLGFKPLKLVNEAYMVKLGWKLAWKHVQDGIVWNFGNGNSTRFWSDIFISGLRPLINYSVQPVHQDLMALPVSAFISDGNWKLDDIQPYLPTDIIILKLIKICAIIFGTGKAHPEFNAFFGSVFMGSFLQMKKG